MLQKLMIPCVNAIIDDETKTVHEIVVSGNHYYTVSWYPPDNHTFLKPHIEIRRGHHEGLLLGYIRLDGANASPRFENVNLHDPQQWIKIIAQSRLYKTMIKKEDLFESLKVYAEIGC
ncbi:hypothetical protein ABVT61_001936 [Salmonella enterica subsp. enterica serovar Newport]